MNIYQKMQLVRKVLSTTEMKKSGTNTFAKYSYFELADFLPIIIGLCEDQGLCTNVSFTNELATLTIINCENPDEQMVFTSPFIMGTVKGANEVQCLGASQTYIRRYLYTIAFDVLEVDAVEASRIVAETEKVKSATASPIKLSTEKDKDAYAELKTTWESAGKDVKGLDKWIRKVSQDESKEISADLFDYLNARIISYMTKEEK